MLFEVLLVVAFREHERVVMVPFYRQHINLLMQTFQYYTLHHIELGT